MTRFLFAFFTLLLLPIAAQADGHGAHKDQMADQPMAGKIVIAHPWARASAGMAKAGAVFLELHNHGTDDTLLSGSTNRSAKVELHTHIKDGDVMRMRQVPAIEVPERKNTILKPGGLHVMLLGLTSPLKEGEVFPLTLTFETSGSVTFEVVVKAPGSKGHQDHKGHHHHDHKH